MSDAAESILSAIMNLPDGEREMVTYKLMEDLPPPEGWEEVGEAEIVAEVMRRHEVAQKNSTECRSADEVHDRLLAEIHADAPR
jgi:hypothetical protein